MTSRKNIVELRQLLAERFPGVRMEAGRPPAVATRWATGLESVDHVLGGGFEKGSITEIISAGPGYGTGLILTALLRRAAERGEWVALIDAVDCFDPAPFDDEALARLLWVRCSSAQEAFKSADILLRDGNISLVVIDFVMCSSAQCRKIPSSAWHRLHRIIETSSTMAVVLAPESMAGSVASRVILEQQFTIAALDTDQERLNLQISPRSVEGARTANSNIRSA